MVDLGLIACQHFCMLHYFNEDHICFQDAIFIMTSNLASDEIAEYGLQLRAEADKINQQRYKGQLEDLEITETITISRRCQRLDFSLSE